MLSALTCALPLRSTRYIVFATAKRTVVKVCLAKLGAGLNQSHEVEHNLVRTFGDDTCVIQALWLRLYNNDLSTLKKRSCESAQQADELADLLL